MIVKFDKEGVKAIEEILRRGNEAEVKRKGSGYVVLEVKKSIKAQTPA